jgi:hypothetical protein
MQLPGALLRPLPIPLLNDTETMIMPNLIRTQIAHAEQAQIVSRPVSRDLRVLADANKSGDRPSQPGL